jgi:hypothetical protein
MRRIETEAGIIVGRVDRALQRVVWHLECPECETAIAFTEATFNGKAPVVCECGWKTRHVGHKERSEDGGVYTYYNYADLAFDGTTAGANSGGQGIHSGMRF